MAKYCPRCGFRQRGDLAYAAGGRKSKRKITPEQQKMMQKARIIKKLERELAKQRDLNKTDPTT